MDEPRPSPARTREASPTPSVKHRRAKGRRKDRAQPDLLALAEAPQGGGMALQPAIELRQLWLAVYLPSLPIEALLDTPEPAAVFEELQGVRRILLANDRAGESGVGPGMTVNAALALQPALRLEERSPVREDQVLRELAEWAEKFTSFVCIEPPALLLLEIAGSLRLFGGIRALRQRIVCGLESQGFCAGVAIAPTPLAATWLARAGQRSCIRDPRNLVGRLGPLPLSCLDWPDSIRASLSGMGIATIGEVLRLPRQGFAKRFGASRLMELDRALGRMPDPRPGYRSPEYFIADFDLDEEEDDATLLLNVCRELLVRLERFLLSRQMAVQHIDFSFFHLRAPATHLGLGCVQADRAVQHWFDLLDIRFDRMQLPAPVIAIRLCGGHGQPFSAESGTLSFAEHDERRQHGSIAHLAERLSARIGEDSVHGVVAVAEHRPQRAWQACIDFDDVPRCASTPAVPANPHAPELLAELRRTSSLVLRRPLWLLSEPRLLETDGRGPRYQGRLKLMSGPERIESGWWDSDGIARDYYVAANPGGVHVWIYRDRTGNGRWYLHGMFG